MKIRDAYTELGFDHESDEAQIVFQQRDKDGLIGIKLKWAHSFLDRQIQGRIGSRDMPNIVAADGHATFIPQQSDVGRTFIRRIPHRLDEYIGRNPKPLKVRAG